MSKNSQNRAAGCPYITGHHLRTMESIRVSGCPTFQSRDIWQRNANPFPARCHQGIPENERWECRKNALSDEMRRYLDTGVLPRASPAQVSKSDEGRPVQAVTPKADCYSPITTSVQPRREEGSAESVAGAKCGPVADVVAAPPAEATISIATLFGWGYDREKEEDY